MILNSTTYRKQLIKKYGGKNPDKFDSELTKLLDLAKMDNFNLQSENNKKEIIPSKMNYESYEQAVKEIFESNKKSYEKLMEAIKYAKAFKGYHSIYLIPADFWSDFFRLADRLNFVEFDEQGQNFKIYEKPKNSLIR